ncbi:MAG: hypothetical protein LBK42_10420 [Propionibacteriaceae bacterium]|jgi:hypothetical protein|nr:hypothetical protein [Propionibacteriaceae bacterium]
MRRVLIAAVIVLLAGCTTIAPEATQDETTPIATAESTARPTPEPTTTATTEVLAVEGALTSGTMALVGCEPVSDEWMTWANQNDPKVATAMDGQGPARVLEAYVGAVVTSPTGDWAVIGMLVDDYGVDHALTYITQNPPSPPTGANAGVTELINVGYVFDADGLEDVSDGWRSNFTANTRWRGDLLALGEEAAAAAVACVS